ncbi:NMCC_0638 family (lipo)protein, partial [Ewingella sp. S1.OA.A_B6]
VRAEVQNMVTQTAKQLGLTSQLVSDRDNVNQLPIKELVYTMQKADAASQYVVTAYTSMSDKTPVKATLNFRLIPVK